MIMKSIYHYTGKLGRNQQIIAGLRGLVADYEACLKRANQKADSCDISAKICGSWAAAATNEKAHWKARALKAEAELFDIKNKS